MAINKELNPYARFVFLCQVADYGSQCNDDETHGYDRSHSSRRYVFRQADTIVIQQNNRNSDACRKSLVFRQRRNKHAKGGNQSAAHYKVKLK